MAIGSWYKTLFLDEKIAAKILGENMKKKQGEG